jgi:hypothetical protein
VCAGSTINKEVFMPASFSNYQIDKILEAEAGRIGPDIHRKVLDTSVWLKLTKQESWPDEMGETISVLTYGRSLPTVADNSGDITSTWNNVSFNTVVADPSNCVPQASVIEFTHYLRTYNLQQSALESPPLCINDLRYSFKRKEQLSNIFDILTENVAYSWKERYRNEYVRMAENKGVAEHGNLSFATTMPDTAPTATLTQEMLDKVYLRLVRDGAGLNPLGRADGRPEFGVILGSEASMNLIRDNDGNVRYDFRYSTRANELLNPLGIDRSFRGFYHMVDDFSPRWNFEDDAWVRVYPYIKDTSPNARGWVVNPDYETAEYEDAIVYHRDVFVSMVPKPITAPGGNTKFDPVAYKGDFRWLNIQDRTLNPDKTIGYFRAVLSNGSKPLKPEYGYVIRFKRNGTTSASSAA